MFRIYTTACTLGGNILEKNQIFFCCTQISMWLYILRHLVKELVNLSQYISPNRYLKISKSPYNRKKNFSRNIVMWVLYQDARRSLIQCKRNQRNPTFWCWENVQNVSENELFHNDVIIFHAGRPQSRAKNSLQRPNHAYWGLYSRLLSLPC